MSERVFPLRRREKWLAVADEIGKERSLVVACATFYCANYSPDEVAETFGITKQAADEIAEAVRPHVRKQMVRGL